MGPPALMPSFKALAKEIADPPIPLEPKDEGALDRYLMRAERASVMVHARARANLLARQGGHTSIHEHLVAIFGNPHDLKLITTNFDGHFTTAAAKVFAGASIPHYIGPALPPGRGFRGIVHLHGSLGRPEDRLVLTQQDFAAAYMTDGWAARFLVGVFAERTVLFVGYSLGDPVMRYLLSALPSTQRWYVLVPEHEVSNWADHDITRIAFGTRADGDAFGDLRDGLKQWAWIASGSVVDHDRELRQFIVAGPSASPIDSDYVLVRLSTAQGGLTFWESATDPAWFAWAATHNLLSCLIDRSAEGPDAANWSRWALRNFCKGSNPPLLDFFRRKSLTIGKQFARELLFHLIGQLPSLEKTTTRQLVALLVNHSIFQDLQGENAEELFKRLVEQRMADEALAVLAWITQVRLAPLSSLDFAFEDKRTDDEKLALQPLSVEVATCSEPDDIRRAIEVVGDTLAALEPSRLVALGVQRIVDTYALLGLASGERGGFDGPSYGRTAIEDSDQDAVAQVEDVFVEIVRAGLHHWGTTDSPLLLEFGNLHIRDDRRLLKRLALYALTDSGYSSDELLDRAATDGWAKDEWIRPEFARFLRLRYPEGSEEVKVRFLQTFREGISGEGVDDTTDRRTFNLSRILLHLAGDSPSTQEFARIQREAHPDWEEPEYDGYLRRISMSWGSDVPSPISAAQMLQLTPAEAVRAIEVAFSEAQETPGVSGKGEPLRGAIQEAVKGNPSWGVDLMVFITEGTALPLISTAILWGLFDAPITVDKQIEMLRAAISWVWPEGVIRPLSALVDHWARAIPGESDVALLDALDEIADLIYARAGNLDSAVPNERGWVDRAINHPGGHAASVWLTVAHCRDKVDGRYVLSIDHAERVRWEKVVAERNTAAAYARVFLGMATDRLSEGDKPWAVATIFPAFDPVTGEDVAGPMWDGRLSQHRWSWTTVEGLRPYRKAMFAASESLLPWRSRQIGEWVAFLVAEPLKSEFGLTDLQFFIQHAGQNNRDAFTIAMPVQLDRLEPKARESLWYEALRPYWRDRRTNVPVAFTPAEVAAMIGWVTSLPEVAPDAVAELLQTPGQSLRKVDRYLRQWKLDPAWIEAHPEETVAIVGWLASRDSISTWFADDCVAFLEVSLAAGAKQEAVLRAADALAQLPCAAAVTLLTKVRQDAEQ
ncbi:MAG: SIR2 family protein [Gemmatimonadota bacterium]